MGAQQSFAHGADPRSGNTPEAKTCYYEVLNVDRHATDDEIKKAYRKRALELHPDRNYGDIENATVKFTQVQSAYEVLSDPQERAWYDSHRDSILRGDSGVNEEHFEHNVRLTSADDLVSLIGKFNSSIPFTDASNGFYGILQQTFETLAAEENSACDWEGVEPIEYPEFGGASDSYDDVAKPFYRAWMNFSTKKTFSWRDQYRASDAPDRATRRSIDKENKRFRDEGIREFNDAVRTLVVFVRKRDPRFIPNSQSEADRQKILRDAASAQAVRSRTANQAKLKEHILPDWAKTNEQDEDVFEESEESEVEHIECVVCGKIFKSEKQYETHEKSKKHNKVVQRLRRDMKRENDSLNLDAPSASVPTSPIPGLGNLDLDADEIVNVEANPTSTAVDGKTPETSQGDASLPASDTLGPSLAEEEGSQSTTDGPSESSELDDEYASRKDVEHRLDALTENRTDPIPTSDADSTTQPKLGKAKVKRAKKAAKESKQSQEDSEFKCAACNDSFISKTKLFNHIKEYNHAQPVLRAKGKKKTN